MKTLFPVILLCTLITGCKQTDTAWFPSEMVDFAPSGNNPVFKGTGTNTWDSLIRERGFILKENGTYHMWYTGYREGPGEIMHLGYATSTDGLVWTKYKNNPISDTSWVEDVFVIKSDSLYYMFAEGRNDMAHMLSSTDRINWKDHGPLDIRQSNGKPITMGPYGTPSVWFERGIWHLFYERDDLGIWLAVSKDLKVWTNLQDEPVIRMGPQPYDLYAVAVDQVIQFKGRYYAYYHASEFKDWHEWTSCVAASEDLIHWKKYPGNPIMRDNKSSPLLINDGSAYRLYTMHPEVCIHFHKKKK
jgi:predicted GH43/DUF377 family glycosyl hydrolase